MKTKTTLSALAFSLAAGTASAQMVIAANRYFMSVSLRGFDREARGRAGFGQGMGGLRRVNPASRK